MKFYISLVLLAITMAFFAGYLSLSVRKGSSSHQEPFPIIVEAKEHFRRSHKPLLELRVAELFPIDTSQFINPKNAYSQTHDLSYETMAALYRYSSSCIGLKKPPSSEATVQKAWTWLKFKCGQTARLPATFFETSPFIFPLGGSYAFQALQSTRYLPVDRSWIEQHLSFFHALELKRLENHGVKLELRHQIIAGMDDTTLQSIFEEDDLVLSQNYVFYRKNSRNRMSYESFAPSLDQSARGYAVFSKKDWDSAFKKFPYLPMESTTDSVCSYREGSMCWVPNETSLFKSIRWPAALLFFLSLGFTGACTWLAIIKFFAQTKEEERKRLALQILTHELRTPISSLLLSSEEVINHFDNLPESLQGTLLRMCDDIGRLQRLAEASQQYLLSAQEKNLIRIELKLMPSVNEYIKDLLEPFQTDISISYLEKDRAMHFDPYWVGVCTRNLVENALAHGKKPVVARTRFHEDRAILEIAIEDAGHCFLRSLDELAKPFAKSTGSRGLGLGLSIVKKIAYAMNAGFEFQSNPTKFILKLSDSRS